MTIGEAVGRILEYHSSLGPDYHGCDGFKCGDPQAPCTGVVTAMCATVEVVRRAVELNANLIVVHEPTNHTSQDGPAWPEDFPNSVYAEKARLLSKHGIAVWRDHDHMHFHRPDGIFTGVLKYLGWEEYAVPDSSIGMYTHFVVTLPPHGQTTLQDLLRRLKEEIGLNGVRWVGPEDMPVRKLAIVGHLYPAPYAGADHAGSPKEYSVQIIRYFEEQGVDVILPGETVDWTVLSYVRDAAQLGRRAAAVLLGHFNWEELGMRYAAEWIAALLGGEVPVTYVPARDMFRYFV